MKLLGWGRSSIGVEIGNRQIAAVQLDGSGRRVLAAAMVARKAGPAGEAAAETEAPSDIPREASGAFGSEEAHRLESVLYRQGFTGNQIVLAVPDGKLMTAVLELPSRASGAPVDQLARVELGRLHKRDPGEFEMGCWDVPRPARQDNRRKEAPVQSPMRNCGLGRVGSGGA